MNWTTLLTWELAPGIDPYIRWMRTPLGSLSLAAVSACLCGTFLHAQGFVVFFGITVIMTLGLVWPWFSIRGVHGIVTFDRARCREGDTVTARLSFKNRMPWGAWGIFVREGFEGLVRTRDDGVFAGVAFVPGWGAVTETVTFVAGSRGEYPWRPPRLACGFPFGLWDARRPVEATAPLIVWPRTYPVAPVCDARSGLSSSGLAARDRAGNWGDPMGVRPYRRGDPLRRVHWGLTARHGQLIVCEVQSNTSPHIQIAVDVAPSAHRGAGPDGSREWSIRVAGSFAETWIKQGSTVDLLIDRELIPSRGGSTSAQLALALDALARIPRSGGPSVAHSTSVLDSRHPMTGMRILVTTDVALKRATERVAQGCDDRLVVLKAAAFAEQRVEVESQPSSVASWLYLDDPERVPACLLRAGREDQRVR